LVHWTGILNLIAFIIAGSVVAYLWFGAGWHWYLAILLWPVIYLGLPVSIGLLQGIFLRREFNEAVKNGKLPPSP
jgi:hypothetical protein